MSSKTVIYVYPDLVFAISFIMNLIILWGTNRIARLRAGKLRLVTGAAIGALYSAAAAYPNLAFLYSFGIKMVFGTIMFLTVFFPLTAKDFIFGMLYFFLVSFSIGGIFFGIIFLLNSSGLSAQLFTGLASLIQSKFGISIIFTSIVAGMLIKWGLPFFKKNGLHGVLKVPVKVLFGNRQIEVEALLDTGNQLQDPISLTPVLVVEYAAISEYLPAEMRDYFEAEEPDLAKIAGGITDQFWSARFRVIPFTSLGRSNGMLVGFRPDQIEVRKGEQVYTRKNVIVGIYNKTLSPDGKYKALLHPDILEEISA
ncbi:peptidase U4 sporulation factor SpoIIGA [Thermincola ferriacetica]|uniref:Peptidase U4 sporulation factor SpoIIGA n=1 Tax=Thermincola ferriacetica TaxID=281456 RepID=A0A0L6W4S6_9FIRM|nr:sigma-E processing peptidase SpoIIGA [Thermincola ferriacetica]KNZ70461.1 peptidase U4 sporulation factor SpoIIGA [Thermincola ferriacetica]